jgi:iodotyrosine deiodinase
MRSSAGSEALAIHRALGDESRLRIVSLLRDEARPVDVREIATAVALHPNTVRDHLSVLLEAGLVTTHAEKRVRAGRPRVLYEADKRSDHWFVPLEFARIPEDEALARSRAFLDLMSRRRSVREFARDAVPRELVENAIRTATTAPSGANKQPWHFVVVSDPAVKAEIRAAAEREEELFFKSRANDEYLQAIEPMGVTPDKPHLTDAAYLIAIFQLAWEHDQHGGKQANYYVRESVGIALGFLLASLHTAGLATLPYAPAPMRFLNGILGRPDNERPFLIVAVGYPAPGAQVPALPRKPPDKTTDFI